MLHPTVRLFCHSDLCVEGALVGIDRALSLRLDLVESLLHLILMFSFNLLFVVVDSLPLHPLRFILMTHIVFFLHIYELHLSHALLGFFILPCSQIFELFLFCLTLDLQDNGLFLPALLDFPETILSNILGLLQILFILLMLLRSVNQLLLEVLFFVLLSDELVCELIVTILHLTYLACIKLSQHNTPLRLVDEGARGW